jgi:hypothetical protein
MADYSNYYTYAPGESTDAVAYIDEVVDDVSGIGAPVERLSPRSFRVTYADHASSPFCHYELARRDSRGHFSVKLTLTMYDGTVANSKRFRDITAESLVAIVGEMYANVKKARSKAMSELDAFRTAVTSGLTSSGYSCIGVTPRSMAFKGDNKNVAVSISDLGIFKAVIRLTRKVGGIMKAYETGGTVSEANGKSLVDRIKSV